MASMFGDWPSYDPHNFSQIRPSDPSNPSFVILGSRYVREKRLKQKEENEVDCGFCTVNKLTPATYHPTHNRTLPPADQVICTESKNILIRHFYKHAEDKLRSKRAASENLAPENGAKHLRASSSGTPS